MKNYLLPENAAGLCFEISRILESMSDPRRTCEIINDQRMVNDRVWDIIFLTHATMEKIRSAIPETLDKVYGESLIMLRQAEIFAGHRTTK